MRRLTWPCSFAFRFSGLPTGIQVGASYGIPSPTSATAAAVTAAAAAQIPPNQQAALAAQGAALQPGVMTGPYPGAATMQQFQVNGQPTTIAL